MRYEPQPAPYTPDPQILAIADWLGDPVEAAQFPMAKLRFRNAKWDKAIGLESLTEEKWIAHFAGFEPLAENLPEPLALRYHGHQFRNYNPDIGDGRGFLFAQLRDTSGRLLDLGTKGSGQTPYSRFGDGRLTLKGAVREILATEMLEALGTYTSKTFSVIETGEQLERNDEPSPTRSAVLVRLSHGHIRIGSFQRLYAMEQNTELENLVAYCLAHYPGPLPPNDAPGRENPAVILLHQVVERLADLAASYVTSGFVHGVLNTDNMNISGESFDYGPWRWLPRWDMGFTAAYFDQTALYAFGRQVEAISWNCAQLAIALRPLAESDPMIFALERFGSLYEANLLRRMLWRLGVTPLSSEKDRELVRASVTSLQEWQGSPDEFFFTYRGGRATTGGLAEAFMGFEQIESDHRYWAGNAPESLLIDEVEAIWDSIDQHDDWGPLEQKIAAIRRMGEAMGLPPHPAGQDT